MKKKIISRFLIIFTIFFLGISLLVISSCRILNDPDIVNIFKNFNSADTSVSQDNFKEVESTTKSVINETQKLNTEESAATPKQAGVTVNIDKCIPEYIQAVIINNIKKAVGADFNVDFQKFSSLEKNTPGAVKIYFKNTGSKDKEEILGSYVLVLAGNFYTYCDDMIFEDFLKFWNGNGDSLNYLTNDGSSPKLVFDKKNFEILENVFGKCKIKNHDITDNPEELKSMIASDKNYFSLIPFEEIDKKLKILNINGMSIFDKNIDISSYPFAVNIILDPGGNSEMDIIANELKEEKITNRMTDRLTVLNMTGCTALVRGTADRMEAKGVLYPGLKIADTLKDADITHISNEITFVEGNPRDREDEIIFSSDPKYIELLKSVGTDVIELTGNHMNDYGPEWMVYTLEMYENEGWQYFAGGRNLKEAYRPAVFDINGNKIAFLGCNQFGPAAYWATDNKAGAAHPAYDIYEGIIRQLKEDGYIVIFTFQHIEVYDYLPVNAQVKDFRRMIEAGADIVSGSQAHHPQAIEFYNKGIIFYGLGNLFFDQMYSNEVRQGIITKHIFYEGRHINTVLITTMLEDYCQPRLTDLPERYNILSHVFAASKIQSKKK
ncbi:MAG: CapA family protein [Candidatus Humimicrobiaceae bacterium]